MLRRRCRWRSAGIITEALVGTGSLSYISGMAQMNVQLPDDLQRWTDARAVEGGFDSGSDYVRDLVRRDRDYAQKLAVLQAAIDEGLASGVSERTIEDIIADRRKRDGLA
ncbi:putative addiction module antidote protein [compost metagenome]